MLIRLIAKWPVYGLVGKNTPTSFSRLQIIGVEEGEIIEFTYDSENGNHFALILHGENLVTRPIDKITVTPKGTQVD